MRSAIQKIPKPSSKDAAIVFFVLLWYIFAAVLVGFFDAPRILFYFGDLILIWLLAEMIYCRKLQAVRENSVLLFIGIFTGIVLIGAVFNRVDIRLFLWGIRQNYRFFLYYCACVAFLRKKDMQVLFFIIAVVFWVSLPLCVYEAEFVSYPSGAIVGDYVGGIYYGIDGVNAPLNIIISVYCTKALIDYLDGKKSLLYIAVIFAAAIVMAAMAELKIFFIEIVLIAIIVIVTRKFSLKAVYLLIIGAIGLSCAVLLFVSTNKRGRAYYTNEYLSISGFMKNAFRMTGYDGTGDLNRFSAVRTLTNMFFADDPVRFLFGIGLGNGEYSKSFSFLTSWFYQQYGWLHYQYFSVSFVFLETGLLGLVSYFMIFISGMWQCITRISREDRYKFLYFAMAFLMVIMVFYNPGLRNEQSGFILYMLLAYPMFKE